MRSGSYARSSYRHADHQKRYFNQSRPSLATRTEPAYFSTLGMPLMSITAVTSSTHTQSMTIQKSLARWRCANPVPPLPVRICASLAWWSECLNLARQKRTESVSAACRARQQPKRTGTTHIIPTKIDEPKEGPVNAIITTARVVRRAGTLQCPKAAKHPPNSAMKMISPTKTTNGIVLTIRSWCRTRSSNVHAARLAVAKQSRENRPR